MKLLMVSSQTLAIAVVVLAWSVWAAPQRDIAPVGQLNPREVGEKLVDAIILVESQGNARCIGCHGERGLMQIRMMTWSEVTRKVYGMPQPFQKAFEPALNRRIGHAYLGFLQTQLAQHRAEWRSDERSLLIAAYQAGPTLVCLKKFDLKRMPASTRDYVARVTNVHDAMLAELARAAQQRQAVLPARSAPPSP